MMNPIIWVLIILVVGVICLGIGYFIRKSLAEAKISSAETAAAQIVENARKEAEALKKKRYWKPKMKFISSGPKLKKTFVNVEMNLNDMKDDCCKKRSRWIKN